MLEKGGYRAKLSPCALALAFGITQGLLLILFAWTAAATGYGQAMINMMSSFYYGYASTFVGGLLGGLWGFIDGLIFGFLVGFIYNLCLCCKHQHGDSCSMEHKGIH